MADEQEIGKPKPFPFDAWLDRFKISAAQGRALIALQHGSAMPSRTMEALAKRGFAQAEYHEHRRMVVITPVGRAALEWLDPMTRNQKVKE